ncbi:MAG: pyridoxamine 5'-phosphate oxidase [Bacteroidota bacterium]|nr:pyridoxamine 5'-phosphate oxidase [Bacteroidota bacterium]MDE2834456.1 pyridoxamine 5'-phosphate oxidase [Bacteroidota bacterium]MDE2956862.1 pyridoxamine 5'-phosphate oxidase [Bacteroidota bacterium]
MALSDKERTGTGAAPTGVRDLPAARIDDDPIDLFAAWFNAACEAPICLPEAMTLATCDAKGRPRARIVLLKRFDERGFVFFTNYTSDKARELAHNPHAALTLHWHVLECQIRIEGRVAKLPRGQSDAYFQTRPRGSRIGAWASRQSAALPERRNLLDRVRRFENEFEGKDVPLPPFWGGYLLVPRRMEFWQERGSRLHERVVFTRDEQDPWQAERLYP